MNATRLNLVKKVTEASLKIYKMTRDELKVSLNNQKNPAAKKLKAFIGKMPLSELKYLYVKVLRDILDRQLQKAPVIKNLDALAENILDLSIAKPKKVYTAEEIEEAVHEVFELPPPVSSNGHTERFNQLFQETQDKLEESLKFPIWVKFTLTYIEPLTEARKAWSSKGFEKIKEPEDVEDTLGGFAQSIPPYLAMKYIINLTTLRADNKMLRNPKIIRVSELKCENCVINLISRLTESPELIDDIYKIYPSLSPNHPQNLGKEYIPMTHDQMEKIAISLKLCIKVYTPIGLKLDQPWFTFGIRGKKIIPVKIENEHATLAKLPSAISQIFYHDILPENPQDTFIIRAVPQKYYISIENKNQVMHKSYKPSSYTNDPESDQDISLAYVTSADQMAVRDFKAIHNLTPIADLDIRKIVKSSENFIGKRKIQEFPNTPIIQFDANASYQSYKTSPFYKGFPSNFLIPTRPQYSENPAFYILNNIIAPTVSFQNLYQYISGPITVPAPTYEYLFQNNCQPDINYILDTPQFSDIDILKFASEKFEEDTPAYKDFRNSLTGRLISGGMAETEKVLIAYRNISELDQLTKECQINEMIFDIIPDVDEEKIQGYFRTEFPTVSTGIFQFHSFILSYAATQVMQKWDDLASTVLGAGLRHREIYGYCVDALVTDPHTSDAQHLNTKNPGDWKIEPVSVYINKVTPITPITHTIQNLKTPDRPHPIKHTIFLGAAGTGKSFPFLNNPYHSQMVTTRTKLLKSAHKIHHPNTHTTHKIFQMQTGTDNYNLLRRRGKIPPLSQYTIVDEFTMFDKQQWKTIIERAGENTIIIALGDFCQIQTNTSNHGFVDIEFFKHNNFNVVYLDRDPNKICRHTYEYGLFLDSLRDKTPSDQSQILKSNPEFIQLSQDELPDYFTPDTHIIVGTHKRAKELTAILRPTLTHILCRDISDSEKTITLPTSSPLIWWDRESMEDKIPKGKKYEPHVVVTADCFQGQTSDHPIIADLKTLTRHGTLYTAVTRTRVPENTYLLL